MGRRAAFPSVRSGLGPPAPPEPASAKEVDLRLGCISEIAYSTLHRKGVIRRLSADTYQKRELLDETLPVLVFEDELEKTGRTSEAVLPESRVEVIGRLEWTRPFRPPVSCSPGATSRTRNRRRRRQRALASKTVNEWRKAEKRAEVEHVQGAACTASSTP